MLATLATVVTAVVYAETTSSESTIDACAHQKTGLLRVVDQGNACLRNEDSLSWSSGLAGHEIVTVDRIPTGMSFFGGVTATCPDGKKVMGGGVSALIVSGIGGGTPQPGSASDMDIRASYPSSASAWTASVSISLSPTLVGCRVFATCAY